MSADFGGLVALDVMPFLPATARLWA